MVTALGQVNRCIWNNNDLLDALKESGEETGEKIWFMPLDETSKKQNRSKVADIKNTGGRPAGSCNCSSFHRRICRRHSMGAFGYCRNSNEFKFKRMDSQGATGFPCRTLIETVLRLQN
ncbi:MAG: hypothetical protein CM15mP129_10050 [Chloroflexota bacterium]|nr:MAG: hypothetical protein CM15mP129_10050 [Chloroflexota bacterium]